MNSYILCTVNIWYGNDQFWKRALNQEKKTTSLISTPKSKGKTNKFKKGGAPQVTDYVGNYIHDHPQRCHHRKNILGGLKLHGKNLEVKKGTLI